MTENVKKKIGRPSKKIDYELVGKLAEIQCTQEEISKILDVSLRKLQQDKEFMRIFTTKKEGGKCSLRRMQWKSAEKGNTAILIWMGKQYLGQSDKQNIELSGDKTKPVSVKHDTTEQLIKAVDDILMGRQ